MTNVLINIFLFLIIAMGFAVVFLAINTIEAMQEARKYKKRIAELEDELLQLQRRLTIVMDNILWEETK